MNFLFKHIFKETLFLQKLSFFDFSFLVNFFIFSLWKETMTIYDAF